MRARSTFRIATTCSRSATRCSRPACCNSWRSGHDAHRSAPQSLHRRRRQPARRRRVRRAAGRPVLLLHGGGQTRHAWRRTADEIARAGMIGLCDRPARPRRLRLGRRRRLCVLRFCRRRARARAPSSRAPRRAAGRDRRLARRHRVAAGAGDGAGGEPVRCSPRSCWSTSRRGSTCRASPRSRASCAPMRSEGFATVEEAADAVAAYLPHRPRPRSTRGPEEESAAASRRPLALALGPALSRWAAARSAAIARRSRSRAGRRRARPEDPDPAGARRLVRTGARRRTRREFLDAGAACRLMPTCRAPATWWRATAMTNFPTRS